MGVRRSPAPELPVDTAALARATAPGADFLKINKYLCDLPNSCYTSLHGRIAPAPREGGARTRSRPAHNLRLGKEIYFTPIARNPLKSPDSEK